MTYEEEALRRCAELEAMVDAPDFVTVEGRGVWVTLHPGTSLYDQTLRDHLWSDRHLGREPSDVSTLRCSEQYFRRMARRSGLSDPLRTVTP